jgi:predicted deacylase
MNPITPPISSSVSDVMSQTPPGTKVNGRIPVGATASGQKLDVPYMLAKGAKPGPVLWINGAVHGDELNGVLGAIDFFQEIVPAQMSGSLIVTPASNALAFDARQKTSPLDLLDMDQFFPGNANASTTPRMAHAIFSQIAPLADVTVNMHTHGTQYASLPYGVYKLHPGCPLTEMQMLDLIASFQPALTCRMPVEHAPGELPGNIAGALDYQMSALGKTAFMMEMGGGGREEPHNVQATVRGLRVLVNRLGIVPETEASKTERPAFTRQVLQRKHVFSRHGGLFRQRSQPGDLVPAGRPIGIIQDIHGNLLEEVVLDHDCIVIGIRSNPILHTGDRITFVAKEWADVPLLTAP